VDENITTNQNVTNFYEAKKMQSGNLNLNSNEENISSDNYANYNEEESSTPNFNRDYSVNRIIDNSNLFKFTDPSSINRSNITETSNLDLMQGGKK